MLSEREESKLIDSIPASLGCRTDPAIEGPPRKRNLCQN
jgi:hypothetical protein